MAKKVTKTGEAPKVETIKAAKPLREVKLEWKMSTYDNGLVEWRQTKAVPESRDLSVHTFNERFGWTLSIERSLSAMSGFRTAEEAISEAEAIVRHRLSPPKPKRVRPRT
jgi:hypothetical protein